MSETTGTQLVLVEKQPEEEWGDIIRDTLPARLGTHPALFMEQAQTKAEELDTLPTTSLAKAIFALAAAGEIHINPNLIVRIPGKN